MNTQVIIGLLLSVSPIFELRGGLPVVIDYAVQNGLSIWPYFFIVLLLNISVIIFIFIFFDFLHEHFMRIKLYEKFFGRHLKRTQKNAKKLQKKMDKWGYPALMLLVAVPIPGTGAWTGTTIAWVLGLNRIKSFIAIAIGVAIAGLIVLLLSLGLLHGIYQFH